MGITKLAFAKKLFGGGGGKREGTAIPVGQAVERIYCNTNNTIEETKAILSQLTYVQTPLIEAPIYAVYANTDDGNRGSFLIVIKSTLAGEDNYELVEVKNIANQSMVSYFWSGTDGTINGWGLNVHNVDYYIGLVFSGIEVAGWATTLTDFNGLPIGTENEKIKNVLSITPF